jgi:DNA-binding LacI/PurR family transcriptional regulator
MRALREVGLEPGRDVLIAGHDDLPFSAYLDPPLTTVRQPKRAIGEGAVRIASQLIGTPSFQQPRQIHSTLAPELVVRQSTDAIAAAEPRVRPKRSG